MFGNGFPAYKRPYPEGFEMVFQLTKDHILKFFIIPSS
jgi:hypothetical protein